MRLSMVLTSSLFGIFNLMKLVVRPVFCQTVALAATVNDVCPMSQTVQYYRSQV